MPAKDIYHNSVRNALEKESWHITNDPFILRWGARDLYIDLGAQKLIAAEKSGQKIAVEVKSFIGASPVTELEKALGQYILYYDILSRLEPDRRLYLAIRQQTYLELFQEPIGKILIENQRLCLLVFDSELEVILEWIP
ncbi:MULTISPECIES: element excision factor XisH family protein [unclassified Nostoc]|uniref:element excision factor XisH family protein n=1 Tax=unclassified Nostoc TaxID=2593658 RepID=UPI002AD3FE5D|nr:MULTISPECIES: element excision factor XisH family protein [unclassified Nostoc]MDZ7955080.1 element excision factor XisH family protein [Nostoc sp. DedQUE09]MDZ8090511.1 element excision factor XisH family protein [Nostoc sp. DedQUE05]